MKILILAQNLKIRHQIDNPDYTENEFAIHWPIYLKRACMTMVKEEKRTCLLYRLYRKLTCFYPSEVEIRDRPRGIITVFELFNHLNKMVTS